jgi:hypothetical protein
MFRAMKNQSETYFQEFCDRNRFSLLPVPVTTTRTPDYTLTAGGQLIVVEVKEIDRTPEELASERKCRETGVGDAISVTPGKTVRKKIADCYEQIKTRTQDTYPGLLVLWEGGLCFGDHTEPYHIRVAMAGFDQVVIRLPHISSGESSSYAGMKHGGSRKLTETSNRSISAVAVLCVPAPDQMRLTVYHNRHAAIPLNPMLLTSADVVHEVLEDTDRGVTEWRTLSQPAKDSRDKS